jgi:hypothetical protein
MRIRSYASDKGQGINITRQKLNWTGACLRRLKCKSQISKYVAVRRNRGEQMKAIVPAAAKRFAVSERTVWVAVGSTDSRISAIQPK